MSTNIHIHACQTVTNRFGDKIEIAHEFKAIQTPTNVTFAIMEAKDTEDKVKVYKDYCVEISSDQSMEVCDDYDEQIQVNFGNLKWEDAKSKRIETWNWGKDHAEEFQEWVNEATVEGYQIVFEAW